MSTEEKCGEKKKKIDPSFFPNDNQKKYIQKIYWL